MTAFTRLCLCLCLCLGMVAAPLAPTAVRADAQTPQGLHYSWAAMPTSGAPDAGKYSGYAWAEELGDLFVWGGYYDQNPATGLRYHPETDTWEPLPPSPVELGTGYPSVVWTGTGSGGTGELIVWGGYNNHNGARYNPATGSWKVMSSVNAPSLYIGQSTVWTGSEMIVWGRESSYSDTALGARYNPVTDTWTPVSTANAPAVRHSQSAVWTGTDAGGAGEMIIWGGNAGTPLNTGARYDPLTDTWTPTSTLSAPEGRYRHTAVWTGSRMIVWGGCGMGLAAFGDGAAYDPFTDSWEALPAPPVAPRDSHVAVWAGDPFNEMIIWGGSDEREMSPWNDGARYDPAAQTWTLLPSPADFEGRTDPVAVWTGVDVLIWGGQQGDGVVNDGARYNPAQDSWARFSTRSIPIARTGHTAVWTGVPGSLDGEMIVWGGSDASWQQLNTGDRYHLLENTWSPVSMDGAPSARTRHTAIWTGGGSTGSSPGEMIIWGGRAESGELQNTGGRYDPVTDTWKPVSTLNAPSPRWLHTAIWTGSEMIVWGGLQGTDIIRAPYPLNTGGRYNPATDTWTPMSIINAPDPRADHIALWTGKEMIVWGGHVYGVGSFNTGGRYNPSTDTWTPIPVPDFFEPRTEMAAAWAPRLTPVGSLIIWGGYNLNAGGGGRNQNNGARFDLASGTWQPISNVGAPVADGQAFAWNGAKLVVWGSGMSGNRENSGGAYDPVRDTWVHFTAPGEPSPRMNARLVWAGPPTSGKLIVWGGHYYVPLNTGGILTVFEDHYPVYLPLLISRGK